MTSRRQQQSDFVRALCLLLDFIHFSGYEVTVGDAQSQDFYEGEVVCSKCGEKHYATVRGPHRYGSFHTKRLAIDLNLFKDGEYLTGTEDHRQFGEYWMTLGGTWGGNFKNKDGNHYSFGEI